MAVHVRPVQRLAIARQPVLPVSHVLSSNLALCQEHAARSKAQPPPNRVFRVSCVSRASSARLQGHCYRALDGFECTNKLHVICIAGSVDSFRAGSTYLPVLLMHVYICVITTMSSVQVIALCGGRAAFCV